MSSVRRVLLLAGCVFATACHGRSDTSGSPLLSDEFANPQAVQMNGYTGDAMEPFLSRDGKLLFFNNSNDPRVNTNLHWATRVDDLTFQYKGEIQGVNTNALEGVASMDRNNIFYFVSNRSYDQTASTVYRGVFLNGSLSGIELVPGISIAKPGIVNFDAEISADGNTLYFVESKFEHGHPKTAVILLARKNGSSFVRAAESAEIMAQINARGLNYAPAASAGELELFFYAARRRRRSGNLHGKAAQRPGAFWPTKKTLSNNRLRGGADPFSRREVAVLPQNGQRAFQDLPRNAALKGGTGPSCLHETATLA